MPTKQSRRDLIAKMKLIPIHKLIAGKRLNFKDMISEIHPVQEAPEVFHRLATDRNFPIGVLFDWKSIE